jgi:hypothetical protein
MLDFFYWWNLSLCPTVCRRPHFVSSELLLTNASISCVGAVAQYTVLWTIAVNFRPPVKRKNQDWSKKKNGKIDIRTTNLAWGSYWESASPIRVRLCFYKPFSLLLGCTHAWPPPGAQPLSMYNVASRCGLTQGCAFWEFTNKKSH